MNCLQEENMSFKAEPLYLGRRIRSFNLKTKLFTDCPVTDLVSGFNLTSSSYDRMAPSKVGL